MALQWVLIILLISLTNEFPPDSPRLRTSPIHPPGVSRALVDHWSRSRELSQTTGDRGWAHAAELRRSRQQMAPLCYTSLPEALYDPQACPLAIARYQYIKRNNQSTAVHSHETERPLNKLPTIWQQYSRKPDIHYQNHSDKQQNKKETIIS